MGLFKRKPDPISERAKLLNEKIAALEQQIQKLASQPETPASPPAPPAPPAPVRHESKARSFSPFANANTAPPRLRSTVLPPGQAPASEPVAPQEPIFEEVGKGRIHSDDDEPPQPAHYNDLGVRKYDIASAWRRLKNHFRGPVTSNPKLVHYLSAGSIQGLRPLRYEKRVARNRFLLFATILLIVLWGLIVIIFRR